MDENKVYLELIKAGLGFVTGTFTQIISNVNRKRLDEKKKRKQEKFKDKNKSKEEEEKKIILSEGETLKGQINLNVERTSQNIQKHIADIERWAHIIKFSDLDKKKTLGSVYIQLDTYLVPAKRHFNSSEREKTVALETAVLTGNDHCVILGQPGAGKTTSLKKICDLLIKEDSGSSYTFPILVRLRDLGEVESKSPILDQVLSVIPLEFEFFESKNSIFSVGKDDAIEEAVFSFLNYVEPIIVLDGFDELRDSHAKNAVLEELRKLSRKLNKAKVVLSCRTGEFNYELQNTNTYELAPLNDNQVALFVNKWLADENKAQDFLFKVKHSPFSDTSIKPLSLAHLCAIYDRIGNIPEQPKTVYRKVVNLLIEEWDEQRSIIRSTAFSGFQSDQKFEFLTHLAFYLTINYQSSTFTVAEFKSAYESIYEYHNLPARGASDVVRELESHTGLFIESGYDKFEFVHKSIQEYLTAEYLVKLPSLNSVRNNFETLGSELAIAVSISSNSSLYFVELVLNYFLRVRLSDSFYSSFTSRIVSENPAFKQDELASVAALVLLSHWLHPENKKLSKQSTIHEIDEVDVSIDKIESLFMELSKSLDLRNQKVKIFKYYDYVGDTQNIEMVELARTNVPIEHKRLPSRIYVPVNLFIEFNSGNELV